MCFGQAYNAADAVSKFNVVTESCASVFICRAKLYSESLSADKMSRLATVSDGFHKLTYMMSSQNEALFLAVDTSNDKQKT